MSSSSRNQQGGNQKVIDLHNAIILNELKTIKRLVEKEGVDIDSLHEGKTPLFRFVKGDFDHKFNIAQYMISKGADINFKYENQTMLSAKITYNDSSYIKFLILNGANINDTYSIGNKTPLHYAIENKNTNLVKWLIERGADLNIQDVNGETPLNCAAYEGRLIIVKMLVERGASPNIKDKHGLTPLDTARLWDHNKIANFLEPLTTINDININENNNNNATTLPLSAISASPLPTIVVVDKPSQCFDPVMVETLNISESSDSLKLYVKNQAGSIIKSYCIDDGLLSNIKSVNQLFYQCKESTPISALSIQQKNVEYDNPLQRIMMDIPFFTTYDQCQKMQLGKSYLLQETDKPVGRIVSYSVLNGGNVVSAKHCGPAEPGTIYDIFELVSGKNGLNHEEQTVGGKLSRFRDTRRKRKSHSHTPRATRIHRRTQRQRKTM